MSASITVRRSKDRGHANHGWLDSFHTFSFGGYYDPRFVGFRSLLVINQDRVRPSSGFATHPHSDMEIISYVVEGALKHQDSMGTSAVMGAGDVQRISAGRGVRHSEHNASQTEIVHFLQIWIEPDVEGAPPNYAEKSFAQVERGQLALIAAKNGREGSIPINQDADVYVAKLDASRTISHAFGAGRAGWLQLIDGEVSIGAETLKAGDGAAVERAESIDIRAAEPSHFLFFDLK